MSFSMTVYWVVQPRRVLKERLLAAGFDADLILLFSEPHVIKVKTHSHDWSKGSGRAALTYLAQFDELVGNVPPAYEFILQQAATRLEVFDLFWSLEKAHFLEMEDFENESVDTLRKMLPTGVEEVDKWLIWLIEARGL